MVVRGADAVAHQRQEVRGGAMTTAEEVRAESDSTGTVLYIPEIPEGAGTYEAADLYARAGWFLAPVSPTDYKNPGSVLGKAWQTKTFRDPESVGAYFIGTNYGIALHVGRSGAIAYDVDHFDQLPDLLRIAFGRDMPPMQSTRIGDATKRGHYVFAAPPGRNISNSKGRLKGAWGEVRGRNGVIIVEPSVHAKASEGGRYKWERTGPLPRLPPELSDAHDDATDSADAATDAEVDAFLAKHTTPTDEWLLNSRLKGLEEKYTAGESRHETTVPYTSGAIVEASLGYYPAKVAADKLRVLFVTAMTKTRPARPGEAAVRVITKKEADAEFNGILSGAIG